MEWLRPEFEGRRDELETREDFERRTEVRAASLSSFFGRYADRVPKVAARNGRKKFYVARELDEFIAWIRENSGTRSDVDIHRAEVARLRARTEEVEERLESHRASMERAQRELKKLRRQLQRAEGDLKFHEQSD